MDIYRKTITHEGSSGSTVLALLSDLHIDASDHDRDLLIADLEAARELDARVSINGDMFDAIVPSDRRRHHNSVSQIDRGETRFNKARHASDSRVNGRVCGDW